MGMTNCPAGATVLHSAIRGQILHYAAGVVLARVRWFAAARQERTLHTRKGGAPLR